MARLGPIWFAALLLAGCSGPQSTLDPGGRLAGNIALMSWILFAGAAAIFLAVMAVAAWAAFASPERWRGGRGFILIAGAALPVLLLSALLAYEFKIMPGMAAAHGASEGLRIAVIGRMWWWEVRYLDEAGQPIAISANEIAIPTGQPVALELTSADVIHSLWIPSLAGKMDMIPGRVNHARLEASHAGVFRAQCAEYCGGQHARMALFVIALPPEEFEVWLARQSAPAGEPADDEARRGREVFFATGCGACHRIGGTEATGAIGPDLTHLGSRRTIGAGLLPNNRGALAGWVANAQALKPGIKMPSFDILDGESLRALAAYLESLEWACRTRCRAPKASASIWSRCGNRPPAGGSSVRSTTPMSGCSISGPRSCSCCWAACWR
jgi:cytochrome c oxidase subunit 2